jgi:predicted GNAT family N-acyltransferase
METQTSPIPTTQVSEKKASTTYSFREIIDADELEKAFRFRYEVYTSCSNIGFLKPNEKKIDIDIFDLHSKHYGIFTQDGEIVANIRVVLDKGEFQNDNVFKIARKLNLLYSSVDSNQEIKIFETCDYPFLSYSSVPSSVKSHYQKLRSNKIGFAEAGRLIIKEEYRGIRLSSLLLDCAMILFILICHENKYAVLCCDEHHRLFYEKYGFRPFGDGQQYDIYGTSKLSMYLCPEVLPENLKTKFQGMSAEYKITGKITKTL